jgi:hypothetical protein
MPNARTSPRTGRRRSGWIAVAALLAAAAPALASDEAKEECKANCEVTMQSCKQDCQVERDSGTSQESYLYRQCDEGCHDAYAGCKSACELPMIAP